MGATSAPTAPALAGEAEPRSNELHSGVPKVESRLRWGFTAPLSVTCGIGLLIVSAGDTLSRDGTSWAESLFWLGLLVIYAPITARMCMRSCARRERVALLVLFGLSLYLVKILHSPIMFTEHDEYLHVRTAEDILRFHHLFHNNPLLPVSALYPGMESVTTALMSLGGMPLFLAGLLVVAIARLVTLVALFLFLEDIAGSYVAGLAVVIYLANPNYVFFDSMFKYESVALGFAGLVMFALIRTQRTYGATRRGFMIAAIIALAATVMTHHLTAYLLAAFLIVWAAAAWFKRRTERGWVGLATVAALAVVLNAVWFVTVAQTTYGYLAEVLGPALTSVWTLIYEEITAPPAGVARGLFSSSSTGYVSPIWERVVGLASAGLIMAGLPFGLLEIWHRRRAIVSAGIAIGLAVVAYPASLVFRFTGAGWETSNRSSEFIFVATGFVLAMGLAGMWLGVPSRWRSIAPVVACTFVVFMGGVIAGWPPQWRMPGPYLPLAQTTRGVDPQTLDASAWALSHLGRGNAFGADDMNNLVLASYGDQNISIALAGNKGGQNMNWVILAPNLGIGQRITLRKSRVKYLLVDSRLIQVPSIAANYYPGVDIPEALRKFRYIPAMSHIYTSGEISIFKVGAAGGS